MDPVGCTDIDDALHCKQLTPDRYEVFDVAIFCYLQVYSAKLSALGHPVCHLKGKENTAMHVLAEKMYFSLLYWGNVA